MTRVSGSSSCDTDLQEHILPAASEIQPLVQPLRHNHVFPSAKLFHMVKLTD